MVCSIFIYRACVYNYICMINVFVELILNGYLKNTSRIMIKMHF